MAARDAIRVVSRRRIFNSLSTRPLLSASSQRIPPSSLIRTPTTLKLRATAHFFHTKQPQLAPFQATVSQGAQPASLTPDEYHKKADAYIDALVSALEDLQEEREEVDVEYSSGVMTLMFPPAGTYVLNKQPPNKQIWLSSPVSGPKRYDYVEVEGEGTEGKWVYLRDGSLLSDLMKEELGIEIKEEEL